jgi:hypothetical protein
MDEQLQAQLDEVSASFQERLADIRRRHQLASRVTATARSRDGLISVEVGAQGQLLGLTLELGVYDRLSPQRLAAAVQELASTATAEAAAQVQEIIAPVLPPGGLPEDGDFSKVMPQWQSWPGLSRGTP